MERNSNTNSQVDAASLVNAINSKYNSDTNRQSIINAVNFGFNLALLWIVGLPVAGFLLIVAFVNPTFVIIILAMLAVIGYICLFVKHNKTDVQKQRGQKSYEDQKRDDADARAKYEARKQKQRDESFL
jgi:hypothetical protein